MADLFNRHSDSELAAAYQHCVTLARGSGSNFFFAFHSLPKQMFREMCALYSYMRLTDDLGDDESVSIEERRRQLLEWRTDLRSAFEMQKSSSPVLLAIADVALRKEIPISLLEAVIDGVESDLSPVTFPTFSDLNAYCYQVAGVVGLCCLKIWGYDQDATGVDDIAKDCGTAFQLTNILRDLAEDAQRGRLYFPLEDLEQFEMTQAELFSGVNDAKFHAFMSFQSERAWGYYRNALPLLSHVSPTGRNILSGFIDAYSSLLKRIEKNNYDVFSERIRLSKLQKLGIVSRSILRIPRRIQV